MTKKFSVALLAVLILTAVTYALVLADTYDLQPDESVGYDSWMLSNDTGTNFGTSTYLAVGERNDAVAVRRALIRFDLSSIPSTATINSAVLSLTVITDLSSNVRMYRVYRVLCNYVELDVTWNNCRSGVPWSSGGAGGVDVDYDDYAWSSVSFSATEVLGTTKSFALDVAEFQKFVSGEYENFGWVIRADVELNDSYNFASSSYADNTMRPRLVVDYTLLDTPTATLTETLTATPELTVTPEFTPTETPVVTETVTLTPEVTVTPDYTSTPATPPDDILVVAGAVGFVVIGQTLLALVWIVLSFFGYIPSPYRVATVVLLFGVALWRRFMRHS